MFTQNISEKKKYFRNYAFSIYFYFRFWSLHVPADIAFRFIFRTNVKYIFKPE